jgi:predicted nucleic acid-binding protein
VRLVIADTGPVNYLLLIGHIEILPALFERVILPSAVKDELANQDTPLLVRNWVNDLPLWADVRHPSRLLTDPPIVDLGAGETAAITLAIELHADLLLMDDRRGVIAALQRGLIVTGTLGLLTRAAKREILDLASAFDKLKRTNFRYRQEIMDTLLKEAIGKG